MAASCGVTTARPLGAGAARERLSTSGSRRRAARSPRSTATRTTPSPASCWGWNRWPSTRTAARAPRPPGARGQVQGDDAGALGGDRARRARRQADALRRRRSRRRFHGDARSDRAEEALVKPEGPLIKAERKLVRGAAKVGQLADMLLPRVAERVRADGRLRRGLLTRATRTTARILEAIEAAREGSRAEALAREHARLARHDLDIALARARSRASPAADRRWPGVATQGPRARCARGRLRRPHTPPPRRRSTARPGSRSRTSRNSRRLALRRALGRATGLRAGESLRVSTTAGACSWGIGHAAGDRTRSSARAPSAASTRRARRADAVRRRAARAARRRAGSCSSRRREPARPGGSTASTPAASSTCATRSAPRRRAARVAQKERRADRLQFETFASGGRFAPEEFVARRTGTARRSPCAATARCSTRSRTRAST